MSRRVEHALTRRTLACVLAAACAFLPVVAVAAPARPADSDAVADDPAVESIKAEKEAALAELDRMREALADKVTGYVTLARRIQRTQQDIVEVTETITQMDESIANSEAALRERAIQLYRTDRIGMLEILLSAESIPQLFDRFSYVVAASYYDSRLITELRLARQESLWLSEGLQERVDQLILLQDEADLQREQIEDEMAAQEKRAARLGEDLARLMRVAATPRSFAGSSPDVRFSPDLVISESNFRAASSMTVEDVQAFLEKQPGSLGRHVGPDHNGESKSAAEMIAEASGRWGVSPKVVLVTLQKEQSLLSRPYPTQRAQDWAMGCGKMDGRTLNKYRGFGNQIWYGAASLSKNADRWRQGATLNIDGNHVKPANGATFGLYRYTPHVRGTMSFWLIYWRYFGDPVG